MFQTKELAGETDCNVGSSERSIDSSYMGRVALGNIEVCIVRIFYRRYWHRLQCTSLHYSFINISKNNILVQCVKYITIIIIHC